MQKLLCSSNVTTDDLTIDMVKSTVNKAPVATVTACSEKIHGGRAGRLAALRRPSLPHQPRPRLGSGSGEAASSAAPRQNATADLLGSTEGVAVLTIDELPLAWRCFALPSFSEGMSILSAARTLLSQSRFFEMETPLDYAIVHGRADLHERLQRGRIAQ